MLTKPARVQSPDRLLMQVQDSLARSLAPLFKNALADGFLATGIKLSTGANSVNHGLGRNLQGWFLVRQRAAATIYDTQDSNPIPNLTLSLVCSAPTTVDLYVF